ncbi:MAG: ATP-dependent helicase [Lachnospiraceae bacterium]|jgi:DNA helicase-2/ATP-dependent DNA helicase PcrA
MEPNKSQSIAISHGKGPMLILAGPGSGKTTVIIQRILHLISRRGVPPDKILAVTFSRAAAGEMKERYEQTVATPDLPANSTHCRSPAFATFHSIFYNILKTDFPSKYTSIITENEKLTFIRSEIERFNLMYENPNELAREILLCISRLKSFGELPDAALSPVKSVESGIFAEIYSDYSDYLRAGSMVDFDDMIILCHKYLSDDPAALKSWQERFSYILVDEFQDISPMQYKTICLLAGAKSNLFAVGDDDQSIYGFRGASPGMLKTFVADYPEASEVLLNINYRCNKEILSPALRLISQNKDRFEKEIRPAPGKARQLSGNPPFEIRNFPTRKDEYSHIIDRLRSITGHNAPSVFKKDKPLSIAILFRNNADHALLAKMLSDRNIPFEVTGGTAGFADHFTALDMMAYMRIASKPSRADLLRIINRPVRYISRTSLEDASENCFGKMLSFYKDNPRMLKAVRKLWADCRYLSELPPFAAIKYIRNVMGYESWLKDFAREKGTEYEELSGSLQAFEEYASLFKSPDELEKSVAAENSLQINTDFPPDCPARISIMTMHACKGLEFDIVFIPDANEGIIPNKRALTGGGEEEERRLFYVAMTRAASSLQISYVSSLHNKKAAPSRFLGCLGKQ